jgi:hypothetical protein
MQDRPNSPMSRLGASILGTFLQGSHGFNTSGNNVTSQWRLLGGNSAYMAVGFARRRMLRLRSSRHQLAVKNHAGAKRAASDLRFSLMPVTRLFRIVHLARRDLGNGSTVQGSAAVADRFDRSEASVVQHSSVQPAQMAFEIRTFMWPFGTSPGNPF